jgi:hypothetical protein
MTTTTNAMFRLVLVSISIGSLLLVVDGFVQNQQQRSLIIRSMVATNLPPSTSSSSFIGEDDEVDYFDGDDEDDDDDEIDSINFEGYDEGGTSSASESSMPTPISTQPIRRYKSLKKEPLVAILGRPNVGEY